MRVSSNAIDLDLVEGWLRRAGKIALTRQDGLEFRTKAGETLVTNADIEIEYSLVENIVEAYPKHQILGEESGLRGESGEFLWVLDPIDGTRAYASGLPLWGISIGVLRNNKPYAGGFFLPATGDIYLGQGSVARYNGRPLKRNLNMTVENPLTFIAVPSNAHLHYEISFPRLRSFGSTIVHLAYLARGIAIAALTRRIRIWDIAAAMPFLSVTDVGIVYLSGKPFHITDLLGGNPSPEPILASPVNLIEIIRQRIRERGSTQFDK